MSETMKPCPFCNKQDAVHPYTHSGKPSFAITCMPGLGGCGGSTGLYAESADARTVWNTRAPNAEAERLRAALRLAIGHLTEMKADKQWHPIGHCPVLDECVAAPGKARDVEADAFARGKADGISGQPMNPYLEGSAEAEAWIAGTEALDG